jgi:hypothetical protein
MSFNAFRKQALAAALAPACEYGATAFRPHPSTKTVLAFTSSLGWLVSPLHKTGK